MIMLRQWVSVTGFVMSEFSNDQLMAVCRWLIITYITDDKTTEPDEVKNTIDRIILNMMDN